MVEIYQLYQILSIMAFVLAGGSLVIIILSFWRWKMLAIIREWRFYRKRKRAYEVKSDSGICRKKQEKEIPIEWKVTVKLKEKQNEMKDERKKKSQVPEKFDLLQDIVLIHTEEQIS